MKLYFSNGSPFARKVRIVLAEKGLAYEADLDVMSASKSMIARTVDLLRK